MAYCFRHKNTLAVSRCRNCLKSICSDCIVKMNEHSFCSADCGNKYFQFMEKKEEFEKTSRVFQIRNTVLNFFKKFARIIILAIILYIAYKTGWLGVIYETITDLF